MCVVVGGEYMVGVVGIVFYLFLNWVVGSGVFVVIFVLIYGYCVDVLVLICVVNFVIENLICIIFIYF